MQIHERTGRNDEIRSLRSRIALFAARNRILAELTRRSESDEQGLILPNSWTGRSKYGTRWNVDTTSIFRTASLH